MEQMQLKVKAPDDGGQLCILGAGRAKPVSPRPRDSFFIPRKVKKINVAFFLIIVLKYAPLFNLFYSIFFILLYSDPFYITVYLAYMLQNIHCFGIAVHVILPS